MTSKTADVRAWAKAKGYDVPAKGRLTPKLHLEYEAEQNAAPIDGQYDLGITDADFTEAGLPPDAPDPGEREPVSVPDERAPVRPRTAAKKTDGLRERIWGPRKDTPGGGGTSGGRAKPKPGSSGRRTTKHPRVPVEHIISRGWEMFGRIAGNISPPVARCMQVQAPVAGMICEDIVRDTVVDRVLQPIARVEEKAEAAFALIGVPLLVGAIDGCQALPDKEAQIRLAFLVPALREGLHVWLRIAGPKVEEAAKRDAEFEATFGHRIDDLMAMFFTPPTETVPDETAAEDGRMAAAQGALV
jgi:hypothetical protein